MTDQQQDERPDDALEDLEVDQTQADQITGGASDIPIIKEVDKPTPRR
jgi:hypothetical protein